MDNEIKIGDVVVLKSFSNVHASSIYTFNRLVVKKKLGDNTIICLYPEKDSGIIKETSAIPLECVFKFISDHK